MFGLKGMSGAMFLNMLMKHLPDQDVLVQRLCTALVLPQTPEQGRREMEAFLAYLNEAIRAGAVTKREIQPALLTFFLGAWWHMRQEQVWSIGFSGIATPLFSAIIGLLFLGEALTPIITISALLVLAGIWALNTV